MNNKHVRARDTKGSVHAVIHSYPCAADVYCKPEQIEVVGFWTVTHPLHWITCDECKAAVMKETGLEEPNPLQAALDE